MNASGNCGPGGSDTPTGKKAKVWYQQAFNPKWMSDPELKDWVKEVENDKYAAVCTVCECKLKNCNKSALKTHKASYKHLKNYAAKKSDASILHFSKKEPEPDARDKVAKAEVLLLGYVAEHSVPLSQVHFLVKTMKKMFPDSEIARNLKMNRTKASYLLQDGIAWEEKQSVANICRENVFSLIIDECTDASVPQVLAVMVRYYDERKCKVTDALLDVVEVEEASGEELYDAVRELLNSKEIPLENIIGFAGDNCSTLLGADEGFQAHLKNDIPSVFVLGCVCHSFALCSSQASNYLPSWLESVLKDVCCYFARCRKLHQFDMIQDIVQAPKHKMLKLSHTNWMSKGPVISIILEQWDALLQFFQEEAKSDRVDGAAQILSGMNTPGTKHMLLFLNYVLAKVDKMNLEFQSQHFRLPTLFSTISAEYRSILGMFLRAEAILSKGLAAIDPNDAAEYKEVGDLTLGGRCEAMLLKEPLGDEEETFLLDCRAFLVELCSQMKRRFAFDENGVLSTLRIMEPREALSSQRNTESIVKLALHFPTLVKEEDLDKLQDQWRELSYAEESLKSASDAATTFWSELRTIKDTNNRSRFGLLSNFMCSLLALPHSSACVERVFSRLNVIKTKQANRLHVSTAANRLLAKQTIARQEVPCHLWEPPSSLVKEIKDGQWYSNMLLRNMKEASWRAACDKWVCNFLEDRKGASTPIFQLYNSYIENNRDSYMDIGQFGKVLRSWFPYRKRRRGKQGSQIYVYQDVALKPRVIPRPRQNKDLPQDPSPTPLKTYCRGGHAKSFSLLNPSQHGPLSVPSMMVGNQKVGPILVSIPEGACTASSTTDGLEDRSECMVSLPTSEPKRKYEDESSGKSLLTHKKKKFSDEDDSSLLMKDEIKNEIEFEEESCLQLDHFLSEVPSSQPLPSNEEQKESGTVPMPPLEPVNTRHRKFRRTKHPHTSCKDMMALARQWVDANLIDKKGATTAASVFFEAYVRDNPDKHLPQNSLAVVIRGKFPTRRKPVKQDSKVEYYYQDLELVKHGDISALYPSYLGTATYGSSVVTQVSTDQSGVKRNNKAETLSTMKNITSQERRPNITKKSKGTEDIVKSKRETQAKVNPRKKRARSSKVTSGKRGRPSFITRSENRRLLALAEGNEENCIITEGKEKEKLFTTEGKEKEKLFTTEGKEKRRQATETERAKVNPVIFTDTDRGIPVAVANPPSESVFSYQGVPCVMIPINHTSNIIPHAQDPTVLADVKGRAVAKMISVSQQVLTHTNETRKDSEIIPSNSQTVNSVTLAPLTTSVKSINMKNNMTDSTHPSYPILQGKIQIKTVASINATDFSSFVNNETSETPTCLVGREHSAVVSSSTGKEKQILSNFEEKEKSAVERSYINKNSSDIQGPVEENNDISCQSLNVKAPVISPSLRPLPDMDVLDYIKSEMAEDDEYVSANIRMKSSQNMISNSFDTPGNAVITHNNDVFMCESRLVDLDRNITAEMISVQHMTGVTSCDSEMAKQCNIVENTVHDYDGDVQENSKNVENRPVCVITEVKSQSIQGNDSRTLSEREAVRFPENVENEVNEIENHSKRESANNQAEMFKTSTQLEGGMEKTRRDKSISKVDQKLASSKKTVRRWDEDIRSFVGESDTVSRFEDSKIPKKRRKKKIKEGNLHQTVTECSSAPVNSPKKNPRHSELPKNTHTEKYESVSENSETRLPLSDKTFDENDEQVKEHNKQTGEKVKRAVLSVTFELLSEAASVLTEIERAQKLEGALFAENPAVNYNTRRARIYSNINNDSQEYFPCIPSSALEDLKLCSYDQSTQLLQHHQACPQLGCQKCYILRAAYVHITLLRHRCQVWHTFTKIVSRHSRACRMIECPVLFCQYMKHELHLSGVSVLCNHHLDESAQLEAEFTKCHKAGTHEAALHCSHQQDVSLPMPRMTKGGCQQQQTHGVEARGLKVMSDLLMPDRPRAYDITTPILHTLHIAAAHHDHDTRSKE